MEYDPFFRLFVQSGVAGQFEKGNNSSKRISVRLHMKQYAAWLMLFIAPRMTACPQMCKIHMLIHYNRRKK